MNKHHTQHSPLFVDKQLKINPSEAKLIDTLSQKQTKRDILKIVNELIHTNYPVNKLIEQSLQQKHTITFRLAWILDTLQTTNPPYFQPSIGTFLQSFPLVHNPSAQRHYARILKNLLQRPTTHAIVKENAYLEKIIETCFTWMIDQQTGIAVKVNCLDALCELVDQQHWVREELGLQIEFLMAQEQNPAMQVAGKRGLKKLHYKKLNKANR